MKTEVYSWRLSADLKAELEAEARRRGKSLSVLLTEFAQRGLRRTRKKREEDEAEQVRLHAEAMKYIGTVEFGGGPWTNEKVHEAVVENLLRKHARNRADRYRGNSRARKSA